MKRTPLIVLFITVAIDLLGFGIIFPLLPLYVKQFNGTPTIAGWLAASFSVMQFLFCPIWGRASDRWGRRPFILMGLLGSGLAFLMFGLARNLEMLFVARILAGVLTAASLPASYAYIADSTTPETRSRGMAMIGVAFGVGFSLGPWIGGVLGAHDLRLPAFVVAGLALANFTWSYFVLPETHTKPDGHPISSGLVDLKAMPRALARPILGELLVLFTVSNFAFALMESTFTWLILLRFIEPQHLARALMETRAAGTVAPIFGVVGVTVVLAQGAVMGGLAKRTSDRSLVWAGTLLLAAALFGIAGTGSLRVLTALAACLALGNGLLTPALSSLLSRAAGRQERGQVMGVQQGLGSLARIAAQLSGPAMLDHFGTGTPFYFACAAMVVAFLLSLRLGVRMPGETAAASLSAPS